MLPRALATFRVAMTKYPSGVNLRKEKDCFQLHFEATIQRTRETVFQEHEHEAAGQFVFSLLHPRPHP